MKKTISLFFAMFLMCLMIGAVLIYSVLQISKSHNSALAESLTGELIFSDYAQACEFGGFSGRPLVLLFGNSQDAFWQSFLQECQNHPDLQRHFQSTFAGCFVDAASEADLHARFSIGGRRVVLVLDLHGPLLGSLEADLTAEKLAALLAKIETDLKIERSPLCRSLLENPAQLNELVEKNQRDLASKSWLWIQRMSVDAETLNRLEARAQELGLTE